ncbi:hypothetical protein [Nocardioides sp.]|uniref:hypothetical protein n=1 Tax=Nocardioides sp. TaxID=35761 RepID=UPI00356B3FB3
MIENDPVEVGCAINGRPDPASNKLVDDVEEWLQRPSRLVRPFVTSEAGDPGGRSETYAPRHRADSPPHRGVLKVDTNLATLEARARVQ